MDDEFDGEVLIGHARQRCRRLGDQRTVCHAPAFRDDDWCDCKADRIAGKRHPPQRRQPRRNRRSTPFEPRESAGVDGRAHPRAATVIDAKQWCDIGEFAGEA